MKYCTEFELSDCELKKCCFDCEVTHCNQRCGIDNHKECKSLTEIKPIEFMESE